MVREAFSGIFCSIHKAALQRTICYSIIRIEFAKQPAPRPSTTSFACSQANDFSFQSVENFDGYGSGWKL